MNHLPLTIPINKLLAAALQNFSPRPAQVTMATAVSRALTEETMLVVEAGTGTGKTFAYLIPALLAGKKVIISTGTKNLQDQLFERDWPLIRQALGSSLRAALLKGRANYLCLQRLHTYSQTGFWETRALAHELQLVKQWAARTRSGDIAELAAVAEDSSLWPYVTSTVDNCLGQDCPFYNECFLVKARRVAQQADLVVINHHLFFADLVLRDSGFGELLPGAQAVIFDEAHQLIETATHFFGESLTSRQLILLARDTLAEQQVEAADMQPLGDAAGALQQTVLTLQQTLGQTTPKGIWTHIAHKPAVQAALESVKEQLQQLGTLLEVAGRRSKGLENCWKRSLVVQQKFIQLTATTPDPQVHWYQVYPRSFSIHLTPLTVAADFRQALQERPGAWVFTSATLALGDDFSHFVQSLGLEDAQTLKLPSPFDYERQSLLYVPAGLPLPGDAHYTEDLLEATLPVIQAAKGRTLFLFTSHRALQQAAAWLVQRVDFPLLVQGTKPKAKLLAEFQQRGNAVLLGTSSFWEGVDVQGRALACVIIDKLPFASPDDPVLKARFIALKQQGSDPFADYQLPRAVIALKQGAGRLIRAAGDKGVLIIGDPRLFAKPYGKIFLDSLSPMPCTRELTTVQAFLQRNLTDADRENSCA